MTDNNREIKTIELSKDDFVEISPEKDLQNIIDECSKILDESGYSDHFEAITKGRKTSEAFYYAGNAVLHAKSALEKPQKFTRRQSGHHEMTKQRKEFFRMARWRWSDVIKREQSLETQ